MAKRQIKKKSTTKISNKIKVGKIEKSRNVRPFIPKTKFLRRLTIKRLPKSKKDVSTRDSKIE